MTRLERRPGTRPPVALYLKALLTGWIAAAALLMVLAVVLVVLGYRLGNSFLAAIVIAAIFAPIVTLRLVWLLGPAQAATGVRPVSSVRLAAERETVFARCLDAVASADGFRIVRTDRSKGVIVVRVAVTWQSFGERVRIDVRAAGSGSEVRISSKPRVPFTVMDQGKNDRNVQLIREYLMGKVAGN